MPETLTPIPLVFWRSTTGREPVREWLNDLSKTDKRTLGRELAKLQFGWPIGLPLCRPLAGGLWELRATLSGHREVLIFWILRQHVGRPSCHQKENPKDADGRFGFGKTTAEGYARMVKKNPHVGSSFESWLDENGIREDVTASAIKAVIALQLASEMKRQKITKQKMATLMQTSRAQIDRLLDPTNGSATIDSLQRAARVVGRELRMQLV